jgi:hypothetical protein
LRAYGGAGVAFKYKDSRVDGHARQKVMTLATDEFIRRFLIHVLPTGFHRIRHYGLFASGARAHNIAHRARVARPQRIISSLVEGLLLSAGIDAFGGVKDMMRLPRTKKSGKPITEHDTDHRVSHRARLKGRTSHSGVSRRALHSTLTIISAAGGLFLSAAS